MVYLNTISTVNTVYLEVAVSCTFNSNSMHIQQHNLAYLKSNISNIMAFHKFQTHYFNLIITLVTTSLRHISITGLLPTESRQTSGFVEYTARTKIALIEWQFHTSPLFADSSHDLP